MACGRHNMSEGTCMVITHKRLQQQRRPMQTVASQLKNAHLAHTDCFFQKFWVNGGYTCYKLEIPYRTLLLLTLLIELSSPRAKSIAN